MKNVLLFLLLTVSSVCLASSEYLTIDVATAPPKTCAKAPPVTSQDFCPAFKSIAQCHCMADGNLPASMCSDMNVIYDRMKATFGSQEKACHWQETHGVPEHTSYQECMDDWNCYRLGGSASVGLCSGTGSKCV